MTAFAFTACSSDDNDSGTPPAPSQTIASGDLEMPMPKGGKSIIISHSAKLNDKSGFTGLNYRVEWDTDKRSQRWSCYKMFNSVNANNVQRYSADNNGSMAPDCQYPNDPDMPAEFRFNVDPYKYSGYDHGHIFPSADRLSSKESNYQTFFLTNMQPQTNDFNAKIWAHMEAQVRVWAAKFDTLYVCKGGTIDKADYIVEYVCGNSHQTTRVNTNHVPVPRYFYMAVLGRKGDAFKATAFWISQSSYNSKSSSNSLKLYATTISDIQNKTGIDFFHNLPDDIENSVENISLSQMYQEWTWVN